MKNPRTLLNLLVVALLASTAMAADINGTLKFGGIAVDETGDRTIMQETYNLFDGFAVHQIHLDGTSDSKDLFTLDLREINLDSRKGNFLYRRPGLVRVTASYDQSWRPFDPDATLTARRRDWKLGAHATPVKWLGIFGNYGYQSREGDRASYPVGTTGTLGDRYDSALQTGRVGLQAQHERMGGAIALNVSDFSDQQNRGADRTGHVLSARLNASGLGYDRLTHLLRASIGRQEISERGLGYDLSSFQYTGIVAPIDALQFKYSYDVSRIEDEGFDLQTDRVQNVFDATYFHRFGQLSGGYVYETNDDDRTLSEHHGWRAGAILRYEKYVTAKAEYAGRIKKDEEELTLLKDVEANRFRGRLQLRPIDQLTLGASYSLREREFPDIQVESEGQAASGFVRYAYPDWGSISADYTYTDDSYEDLVAGFETTSDVVTGRIELDRLRDLRLGFGATFLDVSGDLDIEKALVFVEAGYTVQDKYHLELKYNAYNYDDFILVDRYYTANVMWFSLGYDFTLR